MTWPYRLILLVALGFTAYSNAIFLPFVHDDVVFIRQNPKISNLSNLNEVFRSFVGTSSEEVINRYYRPFLEIFYRLEYRLFLFESAGYHLMNVLFHVLNGILLFALLQELTAPVAMAWGVSAFFLVHPIQTEAVVCVSGISNLLSTFLMFLSLLFVLKLGKIADLPGVVLQKRIKQGLLIFCSLVLYGAALLIKESAIVLLGLFVLIGALKFFLQMTGGKPNSIVQKPEILLPGLAFFVVTILYFLWRGVVFSRGPLPLFGDAGELFLRIAAIPHTLVMYGRLLVFPYDLHYYRNIDILAPLGMYPALLVGIILGCYVLVLRLPATKAVWAGFGIGWFLITLLPFLNFLPLVNEYSLIAAFEHFLYLPAVGFFIFVFVVVGHLLEEGKATARVLRKTLLPSLLAVCLLLTLQQNRYWQGEVPLFERVVKFEKNFGRAYRLLGEAYFLEGNYDGAILAYQKALKIMRSYYEQTKWEAPRKFYQDFLRTITAGLAYSYEQKGDLEQATRYYLEALGWSPRDSSLYNSAGVCYAKRQRMDKAQKYFEESLKFNPQNPQALNNLAICYIQVGRNSEAETLLLRAIQTVPDYTEAKQNLARLRKQIP